MEGNPVLVGPRVARYLLNGRPDTNFVDGLVGFPATFFVTKLFQLNDGRFVGYGHNSDHFGNPSLPAKGRIFVLRPDGSLDRSFNPQLETDGRINSVALDTNGDLLVAGTFTKIGGMSRPYLARVFLGPDQSDGWLLNPRAKGAVIEVQVPTRIGAQYRIESASSLGGPWTTAEQVQGDGTQKLVSIPMGPSQLYVRAVQLSVQP